MTLLLQTNWI